VRQPADPVEFYEGVAQHPWDFDFFQMLRKVECLHPQLPRIGAAVRPSQEPIRLGQEPALDFAPAAISAVKPGGAGRAAHIEVRFLGMLGPNGALPLHLTDYARGRLLHGGDQTLARFLDIFNHRFLSLFYRAWAQAQPVVARDRPGEDRFPAYLGALFGIGSSRMRGRDEAPDVAKLFHTGHLARQVRNREGLESLLHHYFKVPVQVEEFAGHWLHIADEDRSRLGGKADCAILGAGAVIGARVWDRQHAIVIRIGPLDLNRYEDFLPGGADLKTLIAWLRTYLCFELAWTASLALRADAVPQTRLGEFGRLGWTTWLGKYSRATPADDLRFDADAAVCMPEEHRS
jgi:type VI secretion system protein ImpH